MSKRDDDSGAHDLGELGMTTAERRRRRRRGGSLRVPSDNVPRRTSPPPVSAPVPEDPALAMSIAYSFTSDGSEPVPRIEHPAPTFIDPIAPEAMSTVIDPPSAPVESTDFESKTREMSSVDLQALGLEDSTTKAERTSAPIIEDVRPARVPTDPGANARPASPPAPSSDDVDIDVDDDSADEELESIDGEELDPQNTLEQEMPGGDDFESTSSVVVRPSLPPPREDPPKRAHPPSEPPPIPTTVRSRVSTEPGIAPLSVSASGPHALPPTTPPAAPSPEPAKAPRERLSTVALSDDDLEDVREVVRAASQAGASATPPPAAPAAAATPPPAAPAAAPAPAAPASALTPSTAAQDFAKKPVNTTQPLTALDIEPAEAEEKGSIPELDISKLAASTASGEIDISALAERSEGSGEIDVDVDVDAPLKPVPQVAAVTPPPPTPPSTPTTEKRPRPPSVPPPLTPDKTDKQHVTPPTPPPQAHLPHGKDKEPSAPPPPPPAAQAKAPPSPPKTKAPPSPVKAEGKVGRGKPWFVDLFDEDYLRTLPFLTPQATQSEAEFVIDAMGLQPGAQVLDVGCGYGRHAMEIAARGFHVVGLDMSTPLLVRGGEEATRRGLDINFIRGDMRELDFDAQFDGAYCLFSTFGYFDDETNKKTVSNIARALKPGGRLMIEILNRDYIIADLPTRVWWEGEGCVVLEEVELNYFSSRIQVNRSVVFDDGRQLEQEISVRAYSLHEVGKLLHSAGFRVLEVSGGYHTRGRFFGNQSRHIIVLAERKDPAPT